MDKITWNWVPNISIGNLYFDKQINLKSLPFSYREVKPTSSDEPWSTFEVISDGSRFSVEENKLNSVEIDSNVIYEGQNLIGIPPENAEKIIKAKLEVVDSWDGGGELQCYELGMIIWVDDGIINSISLSA